MTTRRATRTTVAVMLALAASFACLADASACACCAEDGERSEGSATLRPDQVTDLGRVRFAGPAKLFLTAAGFDGVKGISDPAESYTLTQSRSAGRWTFALRDSRGRSGTLAFQLPSTVEFFAADLHDGKTTGAGGPSLYKEWRLAAPLVATGIFQPTMAGKPTVRLVLQGRGNSCTFADQFTHWTLVVSGPAARYTLFGSLAAPAP